MKEENISSDDNNEKKKLNENNTGGNISTSRQGMDPESFYKGFNEHLRFTLAVDPESAGSYDMYNALVLSLRDRLIDRWVKTKKQQDKAETKQLYYMSIEYLMGRAIGNNVINLGYEGVLKEAMEEHGIPWKELRALERDEGLGNGGLGRLAACFLDSLATMDYAAIGYGLRYEYGIFKQEIVNGYQVEKPDDWLRNGNPWEIKRPDIPCTVQFGGRLERDDTGDVRWVATDDIVGVPYDMPIVGYGGKTINTLRLWRARSLEQFNYKRFNQGEYYYSAQQQAKAESLTKILYPDDNIYEGKELRFRQEYFFVSCSIQDIIRRFKGLGLPLTNLPDKTAVQLNDTHPALAVPELMRLLVDKENLSWDVAWSITRKTFSYTNHTLMPEALETWPVSMFESLLPRHLDIIYRINYELIDRVAKDFPSDMSKLANISLIGDGGVKHVRMANLSIAGSHKVNGVAELHTKLIKEKLTPDFYQLYPDRFLNMTNGITQRRWLLKSNPALSELITDTIGDKWITDLYELKKLLKYEDDSVFMDKLYDVKQIGKLKLQKHCRKTYGIELNTESILDIQVKRIHEYKRQLLNVLHIVHLYNKIRNGEKPVPRTFIFGGKAAPGYYMAKLIIKLIHNVAYVINRNPHVYDYLKVYFLWDYGVSQAEKIIPAADISEQISTAGTEASGTSNMKFMLNGALTVGTLDGANIEIKEEAGDDNIFIFGMTADEVAEKRKNYNPHDLYVNDPGIRQTLDLLFSGHFDLNEQGVFEPIKSLLLDHDTYMHLADFNSYIKIQEEAEKAFADRKRWMKMSLNNIAKAGKFSSDRTIREYADKIWNIKPL